LPAPYDSGGAVALNATPAPVAAILSTVVVVRVVGRQVLGHV
jgi:hypothetical protein